MSGNQLRTARGQLRQSALVRGRGWPQLIKVPAPAAGANLTHTIPGEYWERLVTISFTFTTSAQSGQRSLNLQFMDGDGNVFNQTQAAGNVGPSVVVTEYGDQASTSPANSVDTLVNEGTVTTPGAGAVIVQLGAASLPTGEYQILVNFNIAGTPAQGTDNNNIELVTPNATEVLDNEIAAGPQIFGPYTVPTPGGVAVPLKVIAAGTAGAIYSATLQSQANAVQGAFTFPDMIMKSGYAWQINVGGIMTNDQISNVMAYVERYPSADADRLELDPIAELIEFIRAAG